MAQRTRIKLFDVVALAEDHRGLGLARGQVGTVVEELRDDHYEVEFSDQQGRTYAMHAFSAAELILLHHEPLRYMDGTTN